MKSCLTQKDYRKYMEDVFSERELAEIKNHIATCPGCRNELEGWERVKRALLTASEIEVPSSLKKSVMESVRKVKIQAVAKPKPFGWILAIVLAPLVAFMVFPSILMPFAAPLLEGVVSYMAQLFYNALWLIGVDIKTFFAFSRAFMPFIQNFLWLFVASTILLIVGFFSLILKGKAQLKSN